MKKRILFFATLVLIGSIFIIISGVVNATLPDSFTGRPFSYPKDQYDLMESIKAVMPKGYKIGDHVVSARATDFYKGMQGVQALVREEGQDYITNGQIIIIPLFSDASESALKTLEYFLLNYVGIIPKNNQKYYKNNNFNIAQIGYIPFDDGVNRWIDVYTLIKQGNKSLLVYIGYEADTSKNDSLDFTNSEIAKNYNDFIQNLTTRDFILDYPFSNQLDRSNIVDSWIKQYKDNNKEFFTEL